MRVAPQPIESVIKERVVPVELERAFDLFTTRIGEWWPLASHSIGGADAVNVRFEAAVGGRVVEILQDGTEQVWADVLAWDPPERFVLSWHPNPDPEAASILEVRFRAVSEGTAVWLEHRGWEEFGQQPGRALRDGYESGWDVVLQGLTAQAGAGA